ncbi:hypothetical protein J7J74_02740 [bacterium]|nr:hypothetical protein [bacterium]
MIKEIIYFALIFFLLGLIQFSFLKGLITSFNFHFLLFLSVFLLAFFEKKVSGKTLFFFLAAGLLYEFHSQSFFGVYLGTFSLLFLSTSLVRKTVDISRYFGGLTLFMASLLGFYVFLEISSLVFTGGISRINLLEIAANFLLFLILWSIVYVFQKKSSKVFRIG